MSYRYGPVLISISGGGSLVGSHVAEALLDDQMVKSKQYNLPIVLPREPSFSYRSRPCAIVWIDILGFGNLLKNVERGSRRAVRRLGQLEAFIESEVLKNCFPWRYDAQLFSDTLVLTLPFPSKETDSNFYYQLPFEIGLLQCKFLRIGFPIRGAVAAGRWIKSRILKSSGTYAPLNHHESEEAIVPRILYGLGEELDEVINTHFSAAEGAGLPGFDWPIATGTDWDGRTFIDYLACSGLGMASDHTFLAQHKFLIEEASSEHRGDAAIQAKLFWMARYHNRVLKSECFEEIFTDCYEDEQDNCKIDLNRFPRSVRRPIPPAGRDLPFFFNWDRPNLYKNWKPS
jgi:hypothetical protein